MLMLFEICIVGNIMEVFIYSVGPFNASKALFQDKELKSLYAI